MTSVTESTEPFVERPAGFPEKQINGAPLKSITRILLERRATAHFKPDPVPEEYLQAILRFAGQAPSGYNLQPWHFVVVRDANDRHRLQEAAYNQPKIAEAPAVVIAFGIKGDWKRQLEPTLREGVRFGAGKEEQLDKTIEGATKFLESMPPALWINRHTMIAVTVMMLVAEAYGLDTAPMEGFDAEAVKEAFSLPAQAEVVALLAIGFAQEPDKPYPGRLPMDVFVHEDHFKLPAQ